MTKKNIDLIELKQIANIRSGLVISRLSDNERKNAISYKQLNFKSLNDNGFIYDSDLETFQTSKKIDNRYLSTVGDIVLKLSYPFTPIYISQNFSGIVVSSNFCIIKNVKQYDSEFLAYYLNSKIIKKYLLLSSVSSSSPSNKSTNISVIEKIRIPAISWNLQIKFKKLLSLQYQKLFFLDHAKDLENKRVRMILSMIDTL